MSNYINQVSDSLKNHISELANNPCLFLRNPNVDFSRKRKIDFKTLIGIMMNSGGAFTLLIIDDKYYFIDLVFYNRLLHCNVIIELKNDEFKHEDLGQLNAYVGYYKKNEMTEGDNPPVGILLCTDKGSQMVEYALSGMDNQFKKIL